MDPRVAELPRPTLIPRPAVDPRTAALPKNKGALPIGQVELLCPFQCGRSDVNESGYCRHLIGFTNDDRLMELRQPQTTVRGDDTGYERVGSIPRRDDKGRLVPGKMAKVLPSDVIVQMKGITSRVYRDIDNEGIEPQARPRAEDAVGADNQVMTLLRQILAKQDDQAARLDALEASVTAPNQEEVEEEETDGR